MLMYGSTSKRLVLARNLHFRRRLSHHNNVVQSRRRYLMDIYTRPSHSRLFFIQTTTSSNHQPLHPVVRPIKATIATTETAARTASSENYQEPPPTSDWQVYLIIAQRIAMAWGMVHVWTEYGVDITLCEGPSMMPTIQPSGEILLLEKISTNLRMCHGGSVMDGDTAQTRIQLAKARQAQHIPKDVWHEARLTPYLENDRRSWQDAWRQLRSPLSVGDVVVTDHPSRPGTICKRLVALPGDQVLFKQSGRLETVPDGHVWLEGDNSRLSNDSRYYGPLPMGLIKGRAIARIWPLRGSAWLYRRRIPTGSTMIPAGYQGEHIAKSQAELTILRDER